MITSQIFRNIEHIPAEWDKLAHDDVFLSISFLQALEVSSPKNISSFYVAIYNESSLAAVSVVQRVEIYYNDIFRKSKEHALISIGKNLISKIIRGNALVVGNLMHTGQHGFKLDPKSITYDLFLEAIDNALEEIEVLVREKFNKKIRIIAFKDFFDTDAIHEHSDYFLSRNYYKVRVQPNMIFDIPSNWSNNFDYVAAFNKKYKRRYRTALKKKEPIQVRELSEYDIKAQTNRIYELYETVSDNAKVNSFKLHPLHFYELKKKMGADFRMFGYVIDHELIGFFSLIINKKVLETYFLGYDLKYQAAHQMYLNMLFDMVSFGIDHRFEQVVFARTAMEIKSSIGAKPYEMSIYLKHTNNLLANSILKFIVRYMNPIRKWEERHPFSQ